MKNVCIERTLNPAADSVVVAPATAADSDPPDGFTPPPPPPPPSSSLSLSLSTGGPALKHHFLASATYCLPRFNRIPAGSSSTSCAAKRTFPIRFPVPASG